MDGPQSPSLLSQPQTAQVWTTCEEVGHDIEYIFARSERVGEMAQNDDEDGRKLEEYAEKQVRLSAPFRMHPHICGHICPGGSRLADEVEKLRHFRCTSTTCGFKQT